PDICFVLDWSATNNFSSKDNCIAKKDMSLKDYDSSLVWYWDMETLTADWKLKDLSGNGNDWTFSWGMNYSAASTGWIIGKGLAFNWQNTYISVADSDTILPTSSYTMQVYSKKSGTWTQGERWIMVSKNTNYIDICYKEKILFSMYSSWSQPLTVGWNCPNYWDWHLYTATFDGSKATLYDNWSQIGSRSINILLQDDSNQMTIWRYNWGWYYFNWTIDGIKIYNRILSPWEILQQAKSAWL
ncbi:MAG: LamG protein, partial [uncultured bacterium (gcode 4)]